MSDLEGFDPDDIAYLKAKADKIVKNATTYYEIGMYVPHEGAEEFLIAYDEASNGNFAALMDLLVFIHVIADSLREAVEGDTND